MSTLVATPSASSLYAMTATSAERIAQRIAAVVVALGLILGAYCYLAASGHAPVTPWSPIGVSNQQHDRDIQRQQDDLRELVPVPVPVAPADGSVNA